MLSKIKITVFILTIMAMTLMAGCNKAPDTDTPASFVGDEKVSTPEPVDYGIDNETARDANINFKALKEENPDIIAWLQVPHTDIDAPVLQSSGDNTFYEDHNAHKEADNKGALYIEQASMPDFSDFMTVIYGHGGENGIFSELKNFSDPDFFEANDVFYIYLDGNLLTYTVYAAEERENTSLLRSYDFTGVSGCQKYLNDFYGERIMGKLIREEWEEGALSPYFFLVALTATDNENPDKQYVVFGCLTRDAAGTTDREFSAEEDDWDPSVVFTR